MIRRTAFAVVIGLVLATAGVAAIASPPREGFAADPPARAAEKQWVFEVAYDRGASAVTSAKSANAKKPIATARVMGRFALELWVGKELLDRVRFDVPLLGDDSAYRDPKSFFKKPTFQRVTAKVKVQMADSPRATVLTFVDRSTGDDAQVLLAPGRERASSRLFVEIGEGRHRLRRGPCAGRGRSVGRWPPFRRGPPAGRERDASQQHGCSAGQHGGSCWRSGRPARLSLRPARLSLRPARLSLRPARLSLRGGAHWRIRARLPRRRQRRRPGRPRRSDAPARLHPRGLSLSPEPLFFFSSSQGPFARDHESAGAIPRRVPGGLQASCDLCRAPRKSGPRGGVAPVKTIDRTGPLSCASKGACSPGPPRGSGPCRCGRPCESRCASACGCRR